MCTDSFKRAAELTDAVLCNGASQGVRTAPMRNILPSTELELFGAVKWVGLSLYSKRKRREGAARVTGAALRKRNNEK